MKKSKKKDEYYRERLKNNFIWGACLIIFGLLWVWIFQMQAEKKNAFLDNAEKVTAVITEIEYYYDRTEDTEKMENVFVEYYVDNKLYTGTLKETSINMYEGKKVDIFYNIDNPNEFIQNNKVTNGLFKYFGYLIFIIGIGQLVIAVIKLVKYLSTYKSREVQAKIVNVLDKDTLGHITKVLECHWTDENGEEYVFYSEPLLNYNIEGIVENMADKTITVRVKDKNNYYVDTQEIVKKSMV